MGFGEAFGTCMRKYVDFSGRARRSEYWWFYLATTLITLPFQIAMLIAFFAASGDLFDLLEDGVTPSVQQILDSVEWSKLVGPGVLLGVVTLFFFIPTLAVTARRLHDIGLTAWFMLIWLVPYVGGPVLLVMCVIDSQARENDWGPDPKAGEGWKHAATASSAPPPPPNG